MRQSRGCQYRVSAKALITDQNHKLLFVEENKHHGFELPGGGIEIGESVFEALQRELSEELGAKLVGLAAAPAYVWFIGGEVVWLIYEAKIAEISEFAASVHIAGAGYYDVNELLNRQADGLGYCCRLNHRDLLDYMKGAA
ncbi:MAG TPA: NUDIX hydrolase [Candidatus Saccharimonadales bacterium]|jgi:8-oxo-dGTP pyrophosphatase MutT (NUDIX family)|nr:NUDIX hydrolase [Candidatus Saccharimonadales bacterium]